MKCKGTTSKGSDCNRNATRGDYCYSHNGRESAPSTVSVQAVASPVTPPISSDKVEAIRAARKLLKPLASDKQMWGLKKLAKAQAGINDEIFPYPNDRFDVQIDEVMARDGVTKKSLITLRNDANDNGQLALDWIRENFRETHKARNHVPEVDVAQRQAIGDERIKVATNGGGSLLDSFSPEQLQGFTPEQLIALRG